MLKAQRTLHLNMRSIPQVNAIPLKGQNLLTAQAAIQRNHAKGIYAQVLNGFEQNLTLPFSQRRPLARLNTSLRLRWTGVIQNVMVIQSRLKYLVDDLIGAIKDRLAFIVECRHDLQNIIRANI